MIVSEPQFAQEVLSSKSTVYQWPLARRYTEKRMSVGPRPRPAVVTASDNATDQQKKHGQQEGDAYPRPPPTQTCTTLDGV